MRKGIQVPGFVAAALFAFLAGCVGAHTRPAPDTHLQASVSEHAQATTGVAPEKAMELLTDGNERFASGQARHPRQDSHRRMELATSQAPFAVIIGCSDSRVAPEMLFDQGIGDLFVVRVAGNVLDAHALGSIEYAVVQLRAQLVVVLGHERCGAVAAAVATVAAKGHAEGHIESLVDSIRPAAEATTGQDIESACKANVRNMVRAVQTSDPVLQPLSGEGKFTVVGAYYDLDTGQVAWLR